jgi:hypothetical protein
MIRSTGTLVGYWDRQAPPYDTRMATVERRLPGRASICFAETNWIQVVEMSRVLKSRAMTSDSRRIG